MKLSVEDIERIRKYEIAWSGVNGEAELSALCDLALTALKVTEGDGPREAVLMGGYQCRCVDCGGIFASSNKRAVVCPICGRKGSNKRVLIALDQLVSALDSVKSAPSAPPNGELWQNVRDKHKLGHEALLSVGYTAALAPKQTAPAACGCDNGKRAYPIPGVGGSVSIEPCPIHGQPKPEHHFEDCDRVKGFSRNCSCGVTPAQSEGGK